MRRQIAQIRDGEIESPPLPGRTTRAEPAPVGLDVSVARVVLTESLVCLRGAVEALRAALVSVDATGALQAAAAIERAMSSAKEAISALPAPERAAPDQELSAARAAAAPLLADAPAFPRIDVGAALSGSWLEWDHAVARWTAARAAEALPHRDEIQARFGRHDVSRIRTSSGHASARAAKALGARAFAHGDAIVFAGAPDLHTAAHEAAHVIQQRAGVDTGTTADEEHADLVADAVVRGESAERLLDRFTGRSRGSSVVQRKADTAAEWKPKASADPTIPLGENYIVDAAALTMTARRAWLAEDPSFEGTGQAPEKCFELLRALQRAGGISWAKEDGLRRLARTTVTQAKREVVRFALDAHSLLDIGLPPPSSAWVSRRGTGLEVVVRVDLPGEGVLDVSREDVEHYLTAIERFTGLSVAPAGRDKALAATIPGEVRGGLAYVEWPESTMKVLVGDEAWAAFLKHRVVGDGTDRGMSTGAELTSGEHARLFTWFASNAPFSLGKIPEDPHAQREVLSLLAEIDASRDRAAVIGVIADSDSVDPRVVREAIRGVKLARDRMELGLVLPLRVDPGADEHGEWQRDQELPARLTQHAGLVPMPIG